MRLIEEYVNRSKIDFTPIPHTVHAVNTIYFRNNSMVLLEVSQYFRVSYRPPEYAVSESVLTYMDDNYQLVAANLANCQYWKFFLDNGKFVVSWDAYEDYIKSWAKYIKKNDFKVVSNYQELVIELWKAFVYLNQDEFVSEILHEDLFLQAIDFNLSVQERYDNIRAFEFLLDSRSYYKHILTQWNVFLKRHSKGFSDLFYRWIQNA